MTTGPNLNNTHAERQLIENAFITLFVKCLNSKKRVGLTCNYFDGFNIIPDHFVSKNDQIKSLVPVSPVWIFAGFIVFSISLSKHSWVFNGHRVQNRTTELFLCAQTSMILLHRKKYCTMITILLK